MMIFRVIHIVTFAICISLGLLVFLQNQRRTANQFFLMITVVLSIWLSFMMLAFQASTAEQSALFVRATNAAALFAPFFFDCLRNAIMRPEQSFFKTLFRNRLWFGTCIALAALCQTSFFLKGVRMPGTPVLDVPEPIYGPGIVLYGAYFLTTLISLGALYYRDVRDTDGIRKAELQFTMLSWATGTVVGVTFSMLIPVLTGVPQAVQFLPVTALFILGIIAYGIATRRIMAVADVLRRLTAYALLTLYLLALYAGVWALAGWVLKPMEWSAFGAHLVAALTLAFSMAPAHGRMQQFANRLFLNVESMDLTDVLHKANRIINATSTRDELLHHFATLVASSVGADRVLILLRENSLMVQRQPPPGAAPGTRIDLQNPLARVLAETAEPLATETLQRIRATPEELQAGHFMAAHGASIAVGVYSKSELRGIVLLGPRLSGRIYGLTEQRALQVICNQLSVGLENTDLYTQVKDSAIYNDILLDSLVTGIIAANREGVVTVCNREAQRILHQRSAPFVQHPVESLPPVLAHALRTTLENGAGVRNVETALRLNGSEERPIRYSTATFMSHTGKQLGALLVLEDLTTLRKLESQVRRTDRLASIGTLSAGMAHEIKNPLVTLKTFTQLLPERYQDADFRDTFSSLVGQEVKRIDSIVNQLLRFARPAKPSLHPARIHEVLDNTLRLVHQQLKQKQISLQRDYRAASDLILGDNDLLVQAFLNFFLNAIDAMENGGVLTVRTEQVEQETNQLTLSGRLATETRLRVAIADNGVGIKPADIAHVFDPFFTTKSTGTGLGLSVSHGIISEHRGVMDVESELGKGSTFYVYFPLATQEVPA